MLKPTEFARPAPSIGRAAPAAPRVPDRFIRQILAQYARPNTRKGVTLAVVDFAIYFAALAAVLWLPAWYEKLAASVLLGSSIANMFALGHEAAHGAIVRQRWLNRLIAILCFGPSLVNYKMWLYDHNGIHHVRANAKEGRNSWSPRSKEEFDALPRHRRLLERLYRAPFGVGLGLGYILERWIEVDLHPSADVPAQFKSDAWRHFAGLMIYAVAFVGFLAVSPRFAPIGAAEAILLGFALPFVIWMTLFGGTVLIHHTHPDIPWFENRSASGHLPVQTVTTRWKFPGWFTHVSHNVFDHTIHHWNARIPCYNATPASEHLAELLGDELICEKFSMGRLNEVLRRCRLYDYQNHRWLDFDGTPTTERLSQPATAEILVPDRGLRA